MSELKQVKVDNWGIYFLQRLKHFFNRTDYCDLTLQFRDNAQLKVHRLVLNACTEYFEVLERTCEMYEDCLVMPEDLQADVVVPIVNFMYTGQLEFRMNLLEKLYQTSLIMKMPVLTKLLRAHRASAQATPQFYVAKHTTAEPTPSTSNKRSYSKAFDNKTANKEKKVYKPINKVIDAVYCTIPSASKDTPRSSGKKTISKPTRYELPEELDADGIFDSSFTNISYTSKPLMVHPETMKHYTKKRRLFNTANNTKGATSTLDIVECKKADDNIFEDNYAENTFTDENDIFQPTCTNKNKTVDSNQLFDQMLDQTMVPKIMIDTKNSKVPANLDHAKIISEVLKKYSHLLKGSKNIKLKILNTPNKKKPAPLEQKPIQTKVEKDDSSMTYETDVIDSKQAARLIAMGAENIKGPWICLICGTPGKALHFMSYYKFRRHLVEVHKEKPVVTLCEYCGHKVFKRNHLLYHLYTKHGVDPSPQYNFPKCDQCDYIALTEGLLLKHKLSHSTFFQCNACSSQFTSASLLLQHMQKSGHKYNSEKKRNIHCVFCLRQFLNEQSLYNHLRTSHKKEAKADGILDDSDDEKPKEQKPKLELDIEVPAMNYEEVNVHYQIQPDGNIHVIPNGKAKAPSTPNKHKILNPEFSLVKSKHKPKENTTCNTPATVQKEYIPEEQSEVDKSEEIVIIDGREYILKDNQLIPRATKNSEPEYIISEMMNSDPVQQSTTSTSQIDYTNLMETVNESNVMLSKSTNLNQPIQFVVSNEEEYKALMAANHPIIFDNGDSNKTLAVLSNHTANLDSTAMELDNAQRNDMMIIQENYPLNVSESVVQDNSNIVVVYSHPVDSANKQFQILTSQGAQIIQSSAIITQNFETVTTTAPMMDTHVIDSQEWENEINPVPINTSKPIELETSEQIQPQAIPHQSVIVNNMSILPEVPAPSKSPIHTPVDMNVEDTIENPTISNPIQEHIENPTQQEILPADDLNNTPQGVIVQDMAINDQLPQLPDVNPPTIEDNQENISCENTNILKATEESMEKMETSDIADNLIETGDNVCSPIFTQETDISLDNNVDSISQDSQEEITFTLPAPSASIATQVIPKAAEEKIQNLTSEWSEDEYDSPPSTIDNKITSPTAPKDAEEQLENSTATSQVTTEKSVESELLVNENVVPAVFINYEDTTKQIPKITNDKISSLLSDWEDSQEDISSNDDNIESILPKEYEDKLRTDLDLNLPKVDTCEANLDGVKDEDLIKLNKEENLDEITKLNENKCDDVPKETESVDNTLPAVDKEILDVLPEVVDQPEIKSTEETRRNDEETATENNQNTNTETLIEEEPKAVLEPIIDGQIIEKSIIAEQDGNEEKTTEKPDDKIKSLVSDWDDDDDDGNKVE